MTLASWFSGHSFELEANNFILHIPQRSFPNFVQKILLCFVFSKKSSEFLFFLILFSASIYLLKDWLKRSQNGTNRNNKLFSGTRILLNKAPLVLIFLWGLGITCKFHYNLLMKAENYQLD